MPQSFFYRELSAIRRSCYNYAILFFLIVPLSQASAQQSGLFEASTPIKLNLNLAVNGDVTEFKLSPDNQHVVYIADQNQDEVFEIFSARLDGEGQPIRLNGSTPVAEGDVSKIVGFSQDGTKVVFVADKDVNDRDDVFSVNLDGSNLTKLTSNAVGAREVTETAVTSDDFVLYILKPGIAFDIPNHLYSVPIGGGVIQRLSDALAESEPLKVREFRLSQDHSKVAFVGGFPIANRLYVANTNGNGVAQRADVERGPDGGVSITASYRISPDNQFVVYLADKQQVSNLELFSTNLLTDSKVKLSSTLGGTNGVKSFRINSVNSQSVYYVGEQNQINREEVYKVNISGGSSSRVSPQVAGDSVAFFLSRAIGLGDYALYLFTDRSPSPRLLSLRGIDYNSDSDTLIANQVFNEDFFRVIESSSGRFVTFVAREFGAFERKVYSLEVGPNVTDNRVLISDSNTNTFFTYIREISENEKIVVYEADDLNDSTLQNLYVTSLTQGQPIRLNPDLPSDGDISAASTTADGQYVVYLADQDNLGTFNIYASEITFPSADDDFCFPIPTNKGMAVICL